MSSEPESHPPPSSGDTHSGASLQDLALKLSFVPKWAREPAAESPYKDNRGEPERAPRARDDGRRQGGRRFEERGRGPRAGGRDGSRGGGRDGRRDGGRGRDHGGRRERFEPRFERAPPRLPVNIAFLPERDKLGLVVRSLNETKRAFPLMHLAGLFLGSPEHHMLKIEVRDDRKQDPGAKLWQCGGCQVVFVDEKSLRTHLLARHVADFFEEQEKQVEPPSGQFVGVGRCRLSGALLGPPNYHGYNEKLVEMHRTRFQHMSLDDYRKQVELVRDPALVEQWKEQSRVQRVYKPREAGADGAELSRVEAERVFLDKHASSLIRSGYRFVIPARAVEQMTDEGLRRPIHEAWIRENRFPHYLMLALRPAFRRMHLHQFKAGGKETFVTAVPPRPLDASHAVEEIRKIVRLLSEHPGWTHQQLLEQLAPGVSLESPEGAHALSPLRWLVEKGHVIEFFDGTLAVLGGASPASAAENGAPAQSAVDSAAAPAPETGGA